METMESNFSIISDKELLKLCQEYGNNAKMWKRKFEELLPEVLKRRLYKNHKFFSIYEFAAKLCGLSHDSVDNVIRVYGQLEDKPILRSLVVEFGWSKLRIVAGIATPETDASWAEKVRVLPSSSLATFVRDLKRQEEKERIEIGLGNRQPNEPVKVSRICLGQTGQQSENTTIVSLQSTEQDKLTDQQSLLYHQSPARPIFRAENLQFDKNSGQTSIRLGVAESALIAGIDQCQNNRLTISLKLNPETEFRLRKLKVRIEKGKKEKISFDQLFEIMLDVIENKERVVKKSRRAYGIAPLKLRRV